MPETRTVKIGDFTIGAIHGHQVLPWGDTEALAAVQRELDCDILVSGHTHVNSIKEYDGKYFLNPGSATGAFSSISKYGEREKSGREVTPSFMLLAIQGSQAVVYVYEMVDGKQKVDQTTFTRGGSKLVKKEEEKKAEVPVEEKKPEKELESVPAPVPITATKEGETEDLENPDQQ